MGKEGLRLILHAFNEEGVNQEDAPQVAEYYLENYRFIYRNPDDNKVCFLLTLIHLIPHGAYSTRETRGHF